MPQVKICGVTKPEHVVTACECFADFIGLVLYPPSPRYVTMVQAQHLASCCRKEKSSTKIVALLVDAEDTLIDEVVTRVRPDYLQLHGKESSERTLFIRDKYPDIGLIKAVSVLKQDDVAHAIERYSALVDLLLFDASPTKGLPGGGGVCFDWSVLQKVALPTTWILAGGINIDNVKEAIATTDAPILDVSSGVESHRGIKDLQKIRLFLRMAGKAV